MRLPILAYGNDILKQKCAAILPDYPHLDQLVENMWETMQGANGCGLAAPQIGQAVRLFVVDSKTTFENLDEAQRRVFFENDDTGVREVFINATLLETSSEQWSDEEGCLSIPGLAHTVIRPWTITIEYFDQSFQKQTRTFSGVTARMIQHEYDHTEGVLFLDYLKPLTKKLMEGKLKKIVKGRIKAKYPMKFG